LPADKGGPTKYGWTESALKHVDWNQHPRDLDENTARTLYYIFYWERYEADSLHPILAWSWLDAMVNHGPHWGSVLFQRGLRVEDDGVVGSITKAAAASADPLEFWQRYRFRRVRFYFDIVKADYTQEEFIEGWVNRLFELAEHMTVARLLDKSQK